MPKYEREGKSYLTIAIGCTGGRHRSVAVANALARDLSSRTTARIAVLHRDTHRGTVAPVDEAAGQVLGRDDSRDDRSSAFELMGVTSPPPSTGDQGGRA
jgi:hypothetical protein